MKQVKKCQACRSGKHTLCDGLSATNDGRPCPCCGGASFEDKKNKEEKIKQRRIEHDYSIYAGCWDVFVSDTKKQLGVDDHGLLEYLPKTAKEEKSLAKKLQMPVGWLIKFLEEHRQDFSISITDLDNHLNQT